MATTDLFPTFTTTGQEAEQQGDQFTQQFGFLQAPAEVKGVGAATKLPRDIGINLKLKTLGREQEEVEDEEAPQDATSRLRKSMIAAGSFSPSPANIFGLRQTQPVTSPSVNFDDPRSLTTAGTPPALADTGFDAFAFLEEEDPGLGEPDKIEQGLQMAGDAVGTLAESPEISDWLGDFLSEERFQNSAASPQSHRGIDTTTTSVQTPPPLGSAPNVGPVSFTGTGYGQLAPGVTTIGTGLATKATKYVPQIGTKGYGQVNKGFPIWNPKGLSGAQYAAAGAATIGSAYTAYNSLKGGFEGINSPMDGLTATSGVLGTLAGLQTMGLMGGKFFASLMGGPVGWALGAATLLGGLFGKGGLFGGGGDKPPMGGTEFRVTSTDIMDQYRDKGSKTGIPKDTDQSAWLYPGSDAWNQAMAEDKLRITVPYSWGYNGFDHGSVRRQAQDNVDYLYAFADIEKIFGKEANFYKAALGVEGFEKYKPSGDRKVSWLERIDSIGNGAPSAGAWLRSVMEYEGPNGERILEGDIYKGVRIDPNTGMPTKVGYADQESFQDAVEKFNQEYYGT